jgi:hypothetical protein
MKTLIALALLLSICSSVKADETITLITRAVNCVTFRGVTNCM